MAENGLEVKPQIWRKKKKNTLKSSKTGWTSFTEKKKNAPL